MCGFLNAVLKRSGKNSIDFVEFLENKTFPKKFIEGKTCILDVLAVLKDGTKINIEVQIKDNKNMAKRSLFYSSKLYTEDFESGDDYKDVPNIIAINIVDYDFPLNGGIHTCFHMREDSDPSIILTTALEIHFINMVEYRKQLRKNNINTEDPLHRWLVWLDEKSPPELLEEVLKMDDAIEIAYEKQKYLESLDFETRHYLLRRKMAEMDRACELRNEREEGHNEGRMESKIEIARNALAEGSSVEFIHKITGLDLDTIQRIYSEN